LSFYLRNFFFLTRKLELEEVGVSFFWPNYMLSRCQEKPTNVVVVVLKLKTFFNNHLHSQTACHFAEADMALISCLRYQSRKTKNVFFSQKKLLITLSLSMKESLLQIQSSPNLRCVSQIFLVWNNNRSSNQSTFVLIFYLNCKYGYVWTRYLETNLIKKFTSNSILI